MNPEKAKLIYYNVAGFCTICALVVAIITNRAHLKPYRGWLIPPFVIGVIAVLGLLGFLDWVSMAFYAVTKWLKEPKQITPWVWILTLIALALVVFVVKSVIGALRAPVQTVTVKRDNGEMKTVPVKKEQSFFDYTTAKIDGVRWIWRYVGKSLDPHYFDAFCPDDNCQNRLTINEDLSRSFGNFANIPITFSCKHCGFSRQYNESLDTLKDHACNEVERRIRVGQWVLELNGEA